MARTIPLRRKPRSSGPHPYPRARVSTSMVTSANPLGKTATPITEFKQQDPVEGAEPTEASENPDPHRWRGTLHRRDVLR